MERGKKIYFGILLVVTALVTTMYFSYAFFAKKEEQHGKLNIIVGTLDYKIESNILVNNQVEVEPNDNLEFVLIVTSLNAMSSKYELYYILPKGTENVEVGYSKDTKDNPKGVINEKQSKEVKVVIKNCSENKVKVTFGVHGGLATIAYDDISKYGEKLEEANLEDLILAYTYTGNKTKPTKFPNKGEGYLVESVSCKGAEGIWDEVDWGVKLKNITSKNIYCNATIRDEIPEVYGDTIQTFYPNIYTNYNPTTPITVGSSGEEYHAGNFPYPYTLSSYLGSSIYVSAVPRINYRYFRTAVLGGRNTHTLEKEVNNRWVCMHFGAGWGTTNVSLSDFQLKFKDGSGFTIEQAINQKYIEPLVIYSSVSSVSDSNMWSDFSVMLTGGQTVTANWPNGLIFFKVTEKSALTGYQFSTNRDWNSEYDGVSVLEFSESAKISTLPLR